MSRTIIGVTLAVALSPVAAGAQTPQQKPSTQTPQPQAAGRSITVSGCVYQLTDQPTTFALRGMDGQGTAQSGTSATTGTSGRPNPSGTTGTSGTAGTPGTSGTGTTGTPSGSGMAGSGSEANMDGAWYRLMGDAKLKEHTGQRVRISGSVTPGKDDKGADIVIHRIQPNKVTVTSIDLKPAPQLNIQSITQIAGQCPKQ